MYNERNELKIIIVQQKAETFRERPNIFGIAKKFAANKWKLNEVKGKVACKHEALIFRAFSWRQNDNGCRCVSANWWPGRHLLNCADRKDIEVISFVWPYNHFTAGCCVMLRVLEIIN